MKVVNKEAATGHLKVTLCHELRSYDQKELKLVSKFMEELDSNFSYFSPFFTEARHCFNFRGTWMEEMSRN